MADGWCRLSAYSIIGIVLLCYSSANRQRESKIFTSRMEEHCGQEVYNSPDQMRLTLKLQATYGDAVQNQSRHNQTSCKMTLESPDEFLMFYFEALNISCDAGYLTAYNGMDNLTEIPALESVCGLNNVTKRVYSTNALHLTILYTSRSPQDGGEAFSLIITSYSAGHKCDRASRHRCDNGRCISKALRCNGFNSCGDGSGCGNWYGMAGVAVFVVIVAGGTATCRLIYRQRRTRYYLNCDNCCDLPTRDQIQTCTNCCVLPNRHQTQSLNSDDMLPTRQPLTPITIPVAPGQATDVEEFAATGDTMDIAKPVKPEQTTAISKPARLDY